MPCPPPYVQSSLSPPWLQAFPAHGPNDNPFRLNIDGYQAALGNGSKRLFWAESSGNADSSEDVTVIDSGGEETTLRSVREIEAYCGVGCENPTVFTGTRIIYIPQTYSWGEFKITKRGLETLFSALKVPAEFLDLMQSFGAKTSPVDQTFACHPIPIHRKDDDPKSFGLCYLAKHVEPAKRSDDGTDSFSIRQMAIYHGFDAPNDAHTFVVLHPSETFRTHMKQARKAQPHMDWLDFHVAVAYAMNCRWREYVNHLEAVFDKTQSKSFTHSRRRISLSLVVTLEKELDAMKSQAPRESITFQDIQSLQVFKDRVLMLHHILSVNAGVFGALAERLRVLRGNQSNSGDAASSGPTVPDMFGRYLSELQVQRQRVDHLLKRIEGASTLFRTILDLRALENARNDSEIMLQLSKKSQSDGRALKTITLLTLVYLPATFVATLLGMGYIKFKSDKGLIFEKEMWIFFGLTVVLLTLTMGYRTYYDHVSARREKYFGERIKTDTV